MTAVYVLLALALAMAAIAAAAAVLTYRKSGKTADEEKLKRELSETIRNENNLLGASVNAQTQATREVSERFDRFMIGMNDKLDDVKTQTLRSLLAIKDDNARQLEAVKKDNADQLEKMRITVDEKLSSTLESRFNESFKMVNERLEAIYKTFGELQSLQTGVNDLNKIFKNVKTRGTWGEVALESLLSQILTDGQYSRQVALTRGSQELVDFVIKLPGKGDGEVLLPIDAKFPSEDYQRLIEASDRGDVEGVEAAAKALAVTVRKAAQDIRDKYIKPPKTTDFAIMYLATEGLYAEVLRRDGLVEDLQNRCRVVVCGPTTLAALLNSLQMGFRSVAIEKRSTEIGKLLAGFIRDFDTFSGLLKQTGRKLEVVQNTIADADKRTEIIRKKLDKVGRLPEYDGAEDRLIPSILPTEGGELPTEEDE